MPTPKKTIVISAVNLNVGGTLTILRDCLRHLSGIAEKGNYRVVALVYQQELADYPYIEYIEMQWPKKRWVNRLWFEYVSVRKISRELGPVSLWLSLHDTTPNVMADRRAVYCHNPFPFYRWRWKEWFLTPKIVLFALFSRFIYEKNIHQNDLVIVQQQWLKDEFKALFSLTADKIVVAVPEAKADTVLHINRQKQEDGYVFMYAASPNSHKNFECICQAVQILNQFGCANFKVYLTLAGEENQYARWLVKKWGHLPALKFVGFLDRATLFGYYGSCDCLIFPSKVETWGLPISEFSTFQKPMLLADLPYAYETAGGISNVAFFDPDKPEILAEQMRLLVEGDTSFLRTVSRQPVEAPVAHSWSELFQLLLQS